MCDRLFDKRSNASNNASTVYILIAIDFNLMRDLLHSGQISIESTEILCQGHAYALVITRL